MTTSRERVTAALEHREPDRVPLDLGASPVTGMQVDTVYGLRQTLGLDAPGTPVKVTEPFQMLGEIKPDLMQALGVDVIGVGGRANMFGFRNEGWKSWTTFCGHAGPGSRGFQYLSRAEWRHSDVPGRR